MVWFSRRFAAPQVRTYAQALAHYESVTPIRGSGRNGGKRPIGKRNGLTYMTKDEGTNQVSFWLYKTPVLTFKTDNTIEVKHGGWISTTTAKFIEEILNAAVGIQDKEMHISHYTANKTDRETYTIQDGMTIKYTTDQHGQTDIIVQGSKPCYRNKLNRQRWKEMRDKFKSFREYMELVSTLEPQFTHIDSCFAGHRARNLSTDSREMSWNSNDQNCVAFLVDVVEAQKTDDLEGMFNLVRELAISCCPSTWRRVPKPNGPPMYDYELTVTLKKEMLLKNLDNILKHVLSRDLFVTEQLPHGQYKKDSNKKYVKYTPREVEYNKLKAVI